MNSEYNTPPTPSVGSTQPQPDPEHPHSPPASPTPPLPASATPAETLINDDDFWNPSRSMWECDTCRTSLPTAERERHLLGAEHWEREDAIEMVQRRQWEEIQAEKEVQACLEMEERERREIEEMAREVERIDEMCRGEGVCGTTGVIGEGQGEVDFDAGVELDESERWEMEELAREVKRIDEMCAEEDSCSETGDIGEEGSDIELGLDLDESERWEMEELAREVRRIDDMCKEEEERVRLSSGAIRMRQSELERGVQATDRQIRQVPEEGEEVVLQLSYRGESSTQGADRESRRNTIPNLQRHVALHKDERSEAIADTERETQLTVQPPLSTPWFLPPVTSLADLPPVLYRVYDNTSVSKYTWRGFAAGSTMPPLTPEAFKLSLQNHATWSSRQPTPYVSVTTSSDAVIWHIAKKQARGSNTNIMVALIDTAALLGPGGSRVWRMLDAMDHAGVVPRRGDRRVYVNEVICAGGIPAGVVFACCRPVYFMEAALAFQRSME